MRHLLACLAILAAFNAAAQSTMPYNPDADDDSYIGASDILGLLPLYGQQFGIDSSLTCDYDGTPIEEFWANVYNGDIIIDSMLVQYHATDSALVYMAGCPDPVWETVSYERAWTTSGPNFQYQFHRIIWAAENDKSFYLFYYEEYGNFVFRIHDHEVTEAQLEAVLGSQSSNAQVNEICCDDNWFIPFPTESASFDESGIHFEHWDGFLSNATYVNIIPYWHYAE